jgi:hypothetical protein
LINFEARYIQSKDLALLQLSQNFESFIRSPVVMLNLLLFFGVKNVPKFQHFATLARAPKHMRSSSGMI